MTRKEGDYIVAIGGKFGAVYHEGHWVRFECNTCARHLLKRRIGTNDSSTARKVMYHGKNGIPCTCGRI